MMQVQKSLFQFAIIMLVNYIFNGKFMSIFVHTGVLMRYKTFVTLKPRIKSANNVCMFKSMSRSKQKLSLLCQKRNQNQFSAVEFNFLKLFVLLIYVGYAAHGIE